MRIFFMRHGEAAPQAETDSVRKLTEQGRQDVKGIISRCFDDLVHVDEIWASHYVRAQQTAQLLVDAINKPLVTHKGLIPSGNPDQLLQLLNDANKTVVIISHQPLIGTLVDRLAGLETGRYRMGTAAIACIETDVFAYGCGELRWLHQPQ
jgi:phosphohistidine phosphatase SixA